MLAVAGCLTYNAGDHADIEATIPDHNMHVTYQLLWGFGLAIFYTIMTNALGVFMLVETCKSRNMIPA